MTIKEEIQIEEYKRTFAEAYKQGFMDAMSACKTEPQTDEPTWEQVKEYCNKRGLDIVDSVMRQQWYKEELQTERSE